MSCLSRSCRSWQCDTDESARAQMPRCAGISEPRGSEGVSFIGMMALDEINKNIFLYISM